MYLVRQYEDKEVCVRRCRDDIRYCHYVRGEGAAWQVLGRVNGYHSTFLVRCFTVHCNALLCAELAQYCTLTFSWSVLIISVSFLPVTSSSKTHMVTCRRTVPDACSGPLHTVHAQVPCTLSVSMLRSPAVQGLHTVHHLTLKPLRQPGGIVANQPGDGRAPVTGAHDTHLEEREG